MRLDLLKTLLAIPSRPYKEERMIEFIEQHVSSADTTRAVEMTVDEFDNIFTVKGHGSFPPCVAAHLDCVNDCEDVTIVEDDGAVLGYNSQGKRVGVGADDKAGLFICLELLHRFDDLAVILFAAHEVGCKGAYGALCSRQDFIEGVSYVLEFDAPSRNVASYTCGGERLFDNQGEFIKTAWPVLSKWGVNQWGHHPKTDVAALRSCCNVACLNLPAGYYNWHRDDDYIRLSDVANSIEMATELIKTLGRRKYRDGRPEDDKAEPLMEIVPLRVVDTEKLKAPKESFVCADKTAVALSSPEPEAQPPATEVRILESAELAFRKPPMSTDFGECLKALGFVKSTQHPPNGENVYLRNVRLGKPVYFFVWTDVAVAHDLDSANICVGFSVSAPKPFWTVLVRLKHGHPEALEPMELSKGERLETETAARTEWVVDALAAVKEAIEILQQNRYQPSLVS